MAVSRRRYAVVFFILLVALIAGFFLALAFGSVRVPFAQIPRIFLRFFAGEEASVAAVILLELRLPRALLAAAVGASLAVSGAAFQGLFRNPLADPYVIGASAGAALGAALAIAFEIPDAGPISGTALAAFAGALVATTLAFAVSRAAGDPPPAAALLLAGTALSSLFSAALSLVLVLKDGDLHRVYYWLLGGFGGAGWSNLASSVPVMAAGCVIVALAARPLDLLATGEDGARSLGLDVSRARIVTAVGASLAAAAAVSAAGIVGFVGLVAPHIVRYLVGPAHRRLLPVSAVAGALLVLLADLAARTAAPPLELPLGVLTSAIGAPFFLYILVKNGRAGGGAP